MTTALDDIFRRINRHVILTKDEAIATTLWVAHTNCFNLFRISPRLCLTSPERACGKTTLLAVLKHTVRAGLMMAHATPAAIFHQISAGSPTLLFDEADASFRVEDMISILNTGHLRDSAVVLRAGSTNGTQKFVTWAPAAFAVLNKIPDTLASRSIIINLRRKSEGQTTSPLDDRAIRRLQKGHRRIAKWCSINRKLLASAQPEMPDGLQNRDADNWLPLLAIAEVAGGDWPDMARRAAKSLQVKEQPAIGTELLTDIRDIFGRTLDKIFSADLASKLAGLEGRPWFNYEGHCGITAMSVAKILAPYGVTPKNIREGELVLRG